MTSMPGARAQPSSSVAAWARSPRASSDDVVAERLAEAARLEEVALHVDDDQRAVRGIELELVGYPPPP